VILINNIDIANGLIFKELVIDKDRIKLAQRKVYLLQSLGSDLGYHFSFLWHGPVSLELSNYMLENFDFVLSQDLDKFKLSDKTREDIRHIRRLELFQRSDTETWFNLLSTLVYIHRNNCDFGINNSMNSVVSKLLEHTAYNEKLCIYAWNTLNEEGFVV
jgi:hypothetical protein